MNRRINRLVRRLAMAAAVVVSGFIYNFLDSSQQNGTTHNIDVEIANPQQSESPRLKDNPQTLIRKIRDANESQKSGWWMETEAQVVKNLKDDTKGSKHQKFLIKLAPDVTLLVSHNIDIAPRAPVREGQRVKIRGRYEWNHRGGVLHWTHHDPKGNKEGGWIYSNGNYYK